MRRLLIALALLTAVPASAQHRPPKPPEQERAPKSPKPPKPPTDKRAGGGATTAER